MILPTLEHTKKSMPSRPYHLRIKLSILHPKRVHNRCYLLWDDAKGLQRSRYLPSRIRRCDCISRGPLGVGMRGMSFILLGDVRTPPLGVTQPRRTKARSPSIVSPLSLNRGGSLPSQWAAYEGGAGRYSGPRAQCHVAKEIRSGQLRGQKGWRPPPPPS